MSPSELLILLELLIVLDLLSLDVLACFFFGYCMLSVKVLTINYYSLFVSYFL